MEISLHRSDEKQQQKTVAQKFKKVTMYNRALMSSSMDTSIWF